MPNHYAVLATLQDRLDAELARAHEFHCDSPEGRAHKARLRRLRLSMARQRGRHTTSEWEALVRETGGHCVRCGYEHRGNDKPLKGYITPLCMGGSDGIENLMPLCRHCVAERRDEHINWLAAWRETYGAAAVTPS